MNFNLKISSYRLVTASNLFLLLQAAVVYWIARISWSKKPSSIIASLNAGSRSAQDERSRELAASVKWAFLCLARRLPGFRHCLSQALAARWILGRHGIESKMVVGMNTKRLAHAWLYVDSKPFLGFHESPSDYQIFQ